MPFSQNIAFIPESLFKLDCSPSDSEGKGELYATLHLKA